MKKFTIANLRLPISHNAQSVLTFHSKIEDRKSTIQQSGMALVVCLALIVLLTAAVLAFFARATSNQVTEASRSNRVEAEQMAKTAADYVISSFLRETTNTLSASNAVPQRPLPGALASDTNFANLIRRSVNDSVSVGETNASTHSTATASGNGRVVGTNRWNAPVLLSGGGFTNTTDLPNWIYINADGSATNTASTNAIGRFAYNAYDVGGLLDANVAGCGPSISAGSTNMAILKGTLAGADLSMIGVDAATFVRGWRNAASAVSSNAYVTAVTNAAANGFLNAASGDNRITSRQDLIKLAGAGYIPTNALPYLTHFTRELARPSLDFNGLTNMTSRYALSQLATLTNTGLTNTSTNNFTYTSTLSPTLSTNNPNFFQVVRAAIAYTNNPWETNQPPTGAFPPPAPNWTTNLNLKAVALGANVIDQFAVATEPTRILLGTDRVAGKKPLPMVMQVFLAYKVDVATTNLYFSVIPQVWSSAASSGTTLTASLTSGSVTVDGAVTALPTATVTVNTPGTAGASAMTNGNAIPALSGFFATTVPLTNASPANLAINLTGLSLILNSPTANAYNAFGTNAASSANLPISAELTANVTITTPVTTNVLDGFTIQTVDPRTLRLAGGTNTFFGTNALTTMILPVSTPAYANSITDTTIASPTSQISSVGELGRVFRESPWRTMDFVSADSPDKALLDAFSAYATPTNAAGLPVRAGVIDLNTRQSVVLAALLSGAATSAANTGFLSPANATTIANQMVASTAAAANSLTNRSQLVDLVADNTLTIASGGDKGVRETAIRALAEVGQTRTWNIMVDVVAQTGTFPAPPANPSESNFRVQGERRLWIHAAIDRPTQSVISEATEAVLE
jgi:hypothetical protein